jgi:hypothetical protein
MPDEDGTGGGPITSTRQSMASSGSPVSTLVSALVVVAGTIAVNIAKPRTSVSRFLMRQYLRGERRTHS